MPLCLDLNTNMKYTVKKLDGRFAHNNYFEYCIEFSRELFGPYDYHKAMMWMIVTYGYSAEVRDYMQIQSMMKKRQQFNVPDSDNPEFINGNWTWTNGAENLRLYIRDEKVLTMFKLKWDKDEG